MNNGRRWLAFDADFFFNPFTIRLRKRFGTAGILVWVAFLCACKRSLTPGTIHYSTDDHLLDQLGIIGLVDLVDDDGKAWTLRDFWMFTGTQKQTARMSRRGFTYVSSSHWEAWQKDARRSANTQRMAENRRAHTAHIPRTENAQKRARKERDKENPPTPLEGGRKCAPHGDPLPVDFVDLKAVTGTRAVMRGDP